MFLAHSSCFLPLLLHPGFAAATTLTGCVLARYVGADERNAAVQSTCCQSSPGDSSLWDALASVSFKRGFGALLSQGLGERLCQKMNNRYAQLYSDSGWIQQVVLFPA